MVAVDDDLRTRLDAVATVAAGLGPEAADREAEHKLPTEQLSHLLAAGAGALRVPVEYGGSGAPVRVLADVLIDIAAGDSNLAQIFRGHLGLTEILRFADPGPARETLLRSAAGGAFFGPAGAELSTPNLKELATSLRRDGDHYLLSGRKYYTTGSLYADWLNVLVSVDGEFVSAIVPRRSEGVTVIDDWDGFGQRLTASGTAVFESVRVDPDYLLRHRDPLTNDYMEAFYQFVHSATQAGIARAVADDLADLVRGRARSYPLASTPEPAADPQVLQIVGEVRGKAYSARANVLHLAGTLDEFLADPSPARAERALLDSAATQVVNTDLVGAATWQFFNAGSASALKTRLGLDRHWRNARTVSSHNPAVYKAALIGDHAVNGTRPRSFLNSLGDS
ncbi:alkylation response protein AidB-like acyl-CoA dehydrogenase [Nocardia transvalensis]|uniref:Dibenzothiophene monooxygenase n=1 Tax=Nocardia transvalensis TaxID=37333 RepID=A0A7W9P9Q4_9NOCA|nr:acyl-CoA dehydrogenase family protein [Nocardia transvalensis]MBB5912099.1 alkylation response protein AidB-like acyl-CoA dehydrogenase [Nocardia transvalensis]